MRPVMSFNVVPSLPEPLKRLRDLAYNLRWAWSHDTIELFRRLDRELWESTNHNPVLMLGAIDQEKLQKAAEDDAFLAHLDRADRSLAAYLAGEPNWFRRNYGKNDPPLVVYFSAEFGVTESLSIFAGGLGVLAGDHLKSASDLGIPLVGVGLLYQQGYFQQYLNAAGWQQEQYDDNDFQNLPVQLERGADGEPVTVRMNYPGFPVVARVWRARVGRISLFLLDTNFPENTRAEDRDITDQPLRRRQRDAAQAGNPAGHRRPARAGGAGIGADRLSHERRALGIPGAGTDSPPDGEAQPLLRRRAGAGIGRAGLHDAHAGRRRARLFPARPDVALLRRLRAVAGIIDGPVHGAGPPQSERFQREVLHDRAGAAAGHLHQRRQQAARLGEPEDVAADLARSAAGRDPHRGRHQRGSFLFLDLRRNACNSTTGISDRLGARSPARRTCGSASSRFRPKSCGARTSGAASAWWLLRGANSASSCGTAARRKPRSMRPKRC